MNQHADDGDDIRRSDLRSSVDATSHFLPKCMIRPLARCCATLIPTPSLTSHPNNFLSLSDLTTGVHADCFLGVLP